MKRVKVFMLLILYFISFNSSLAFDGQREGFVLGLGIGAGVVNASGNGQTTNVMSPMLSGSLSYGFNDIFQLGVGKKALVGFKYNNETVYQELGGITAEFFMDDYYITLGAGISGATNKFSLNDYLLGNASYIGVGYEFSQGLNLEFVVGNAKFDTTSSTVVTPEKETFFGVLLTTYLY